MSTGMVAPAVALTESGVLVNGLSATDLLSGFEVRCEDVGGMGDREGDGGPEFRGSGVPLRRLEAVRELVGEVLEVRAEDPELTSANPVVPRTVFPWGIGTSCPDVLVVGPDKDATASYLRMTGLRARTVDVTRALRLAGDLAAARAELDDQPDDHHRDDDPVRECVEDVGTRTVRRREPVKAGKAAFVAAGVAGAALLASLALVVLAPDATDVPDTTDVAEALDATEAPEVPEAGGEAGGHREQGPPPWREMTAGDGDGDGAGATATARVTVDVPGWTVAESTPEREIWTSGDGGMRVLVAATGTPVGTQDELDAAMLGALDGLDGGGVTVTSRSPVAYEEHFPDSTTSWTVRLVDGHQVSVGCQYREATAERMEVCDRFGATARVPGTQG